MSSKRKINASNATKQKKTVRISTAPKPLSQEELEKEKNVFMSVLTAMKADGTVSLSVEEKKRARKPRVVPFPKLPTKKTLEGRHPLFVDSIGRKYYRRSGTITTYFRTRLDKVQQEMSGQVASLTSSLSSSALTDSKGELCILWCSWSDVIVPKKGSVIRVSEYQPFNAAATTSSVAATAPRELNILDSSYEYQMIIDRNGRIDGKVVRTGWVIVHLSNEFKQILSEERKQVKEDMKMIKTQDVIASKSKKLDTLLKEAKKIQDELTASAATTPTPSTSTSTPVVTTTAMTTTELAKPLTAAAAPQQETKAQETTQVQTMQAMQAAIDELKAALKRKSSKQDMEEDEEEEEEEEEEEVTKPKPKTRSQRRQPRVVAKRGFYSLE